MVNEYHEEFLKLFGCDNPNGLQSLKEMKATLERLLAEMDTDATPVDPFAKRDKYIWRYAWAVPNELAIETILKYEPIIEIGAGGGYWAKCVRDRGGWILPVDNRSTHQHPDTKQWLDVRYAGPEILDGYPGQEHHALMLCWPPMSNMAADALKRYRGETLIYIGEFSGCNADDEFFDILEKGWTEAQSVNIPRWPFMHDRLTIYKKGRNDNAKA